MFYPRTKLYLLMFHNFWKMFHVKAWTLPDSLTPRATNTVCASVYTLHFIVKTSVSQIEIVWTFGTNTGGRGARISDAYGYVSCVCLRSFFQGINSEYCVCFLLQWLFKHVDLNPLTFGLVAFKGASLSLTVWRINKYNFYR